MTITTETILSARGVRKSFGTGTARTEILHGIDLDIAPGEFVSIMGPSGSGKSTLLYCLSGMDHVSDGMVRLAGKEITSLSQADLAALRLTEMGFVFQQVHLLRNLTIADNVVLPGMSVPGRDRAAVAERARTLLERMGIADLADRDITAASGGQLQRAAIARALINEPRVLFGDEPTGALNATVAAEIMDLLQEVNRDGCTVVLVTHDVNVAVRTNRVIVLNDGRVAGDLRRADSGSDSEWAEILTGWLTERGV